jgi:hypothetical protein
MGSETLKGSSYRFRHASFRASFVVIPVAGVPPHGKERR